MTFWLFLSGIIAPAVFWVAYFFYKDRFRPEPLRNLGCAYLLGFLAAFLCRQFYRLLPVLGIPEDPSAIMDSDRLQFFFYSLGVIGLIEEFFKFLPFLIILFFFKSFDEKTDGIIYAAMIALGFASYENMNYLVYLEGFALFGRAFASPLTHTVFASIWGYSLGRARIRNHSLVKAFVVGFPLAALAHGLFDFFTTSSQLRIAGALTILCIWIWRIRILERGNGRNSHS
jgi:RsiW-degrading membrane proteinase PrsW (M82 family)